MSLLRVGTVQEPTCPTCSQPATTGHEIPEIYDGVLIWECDSNHLWPRFPAGPRHQAALDVIEKDDDQ